MAELVEAQPQATLQPSPSPAASDQPAQNTIEGEAPPKEEVVETPQQATEDRPEKPGKNSFERKISRLYRREAEAKARADLLEKELNELRAKVTPTPQADGAEPKLDQYDDIEKYAKAKADYQAKKAVQEYEKKQREQNSQAQTARISTEWEERAERGSSKYDDWEDVVGDIKPTHPLTIAIMRASNGEDVAYHLGKNTKEASRIAGLDPLSQVMAIGELSARLALTPPKAKTPSKAPAPIAPVTGTSSPPSDAPSEQDDMQTWMRKRQKQVHKRA